MICRILLFISNSNFNNEFAANDSQQRSMANAKPLVGDAGFRQHVLDLFHLIRSDWGTVRVEPFASGQIDGNNLKFRFYGNELLVIGDVPLPALCMRAQ